MKSELQVWLIQADFRKIMEAASSGNRTFGALINLTYSDDPLVSWRAVDAVGRCSAMLATVRPGVLINYLRRLFWMMTDESGSMALRAPELIGEIVRTGPKEFKDFLPLTIALLDLEPEDRPKFLPGILYALGRVGEAAPGFVDERLPDIEHTLGDPSPQVRGMAVCCIERIGRHEVLLRHSELEQDEGQVRIYENENILDTTVGARYRELTMEQSGPIKHR